MWGPWLSANYGIRRPHIVDDNVTISEIIGMWDAVKSGNG